MHNKAFFRNKPKLLLKLLSSSLLIFLLSCRNEDKSEVYLFEDISHSYSGINFKNIIPENELTNSFIYEYVYNGGGVAVGDINNDGLDDIYLISNLHENQLYLNKGKLKFENITKTSNTTGGRGWSTGTNMIDINNDGLLDIYVCKSGPFEKASLLANELYVNMGVNEEGVPTFVESAKEFGLNDTSYSIQSAFLDFDKDGDLDMYLMNHNPQTIGKKGTETFSPLGDKFYVNENGKYIDKTKEVGIFSNAISYGLGIGVSDLNLDGWPDIYVSNDYYERDYMYINQKNGTFKEVVKEATNHISNFAMGNDIADFDNDGYVDILTLDMVSEDNYGMKTSMASMNPEKFNKNVEDGRHYQYMYNTFQKHSTYIDDKGTPFFSDVAQMTGVSNTDWSWGPLLADFDNDGLKDIFITNGIKRDFRNKDFYNSMQDYMKKNPDALTNSDKINSLIKKTPNRPYQNYFYKNNGGLNFIKATSLWYPKAKKTYSNGAAYSDLDNDGDLDLVINNVDTYASILKNNSSNKLNFLSLEFKGMKNNHYGIGVKVEVFTNSEKQLFENYCVRGYQSSIPPKIHIGLGKKTEIDSLYIYWPDDKFQKLLNPDVNNKLIIRHSDAKLVDRLTKTNEQNIVTKIEIENKFIHKENEFDDYSLQILLPHKMSQFGPAIAVGDINNDGLDDIYIGQSTGNKSSLYTQNLSGKFKVYQSFDDDAIHEDIDAHFFDFDNDGDLDLYVSSGGNEFEANSTNYADRLYENRGGEFIRNNNLLPVNLNISSSKILIEDYNKDGYLDIFVGGRHVPNNYPAPASSYLLINNNGKFEDVTAKNAPELKNLGLITDATWTDYDKDGDVDLCVVGEWLAPTFFENKNNTFKRVVSKSLDSLSGWYYSIKPLDLDNDGDDDYLVGNLGSNYKYKASINEPFEVYYDDFDTNGKKDLVLGYYNFGELYPVRGRECSSQQMPSIKKITSSYDEFGKSTLDEIYGTNNLNKSLHLSSYNFKSGALKNNGNGNFVFIEFPEIAQISSINDMLIKDIDGDNNNDLIIAGNLFTSEIETPRNDAGYGMILMNQGNFVFKHIGASKSGLFSPKDTKKIKEIRIKGESYILFGNNNDDVDLFKIN